MQSTKSLLDHTLLRRVTSVRSRCFTRPSKRGKRLVDGAKPLSSMANGDLRLSVCEHYENGCCLGPDGHFDRAVCVANFISALVFSGIFGLVTSDNPSANRWLTCMETLGMIVLGMLLHLILPRSWRLAFGEKEVPRDLTHSDDFHKMARAKAWRALLWLTAENTLLNSSVICFMCESAEHCLQSVQRLDMEGGILEVLATVAHPFLVCLNSLTQILLDPLASPLRIVLRNFEAYGLEKVAEAMDRIACVGLGLAARWWRMFEFYDDWPYRFARVVGDAVDPKIQLSKLYGKQR